MMNQLRDLVRRHIAEELNRAEFRRQLAARFFAATDRNPELSGLYDAIESAFSALDRGYIDERVFRHHLAQLVPVVVGSNVVLSFNQVASNPANVARVLSFSANRVSSLSGPVPANRAFLGELVELEG